MTATVLLIRHAAHDRLGRILCGRMPGVTLSEQGVQQAQALAERLRAAPLAAVYSSPLERARQTAAPIAAVHGLDVSADDALMEVDFGDWSGSSFEALRSDPEWARWNADRPRAMPPGGETLLQAQDRIARFICRVRDRHDGQTVAVASHADIIRAGLAWALGLPGESWSRLEISPACVSRVDIGDWGVKVWSMNAETAA